MVKSGSAGQMNQNQIWEHFWLFAREKGKEITELVMMQADDFDTPRLHKNTIYQLIMLNKIEEVMDIHGYKDPPDILPSSPHSVNHQMRSSFTLAKSRSIVKTKEEIGTVPVSNNLEVVAHANELSNKR